MNYVLIGDVHSQFTKFEKAVRWIQANVEDYHIIQGGDLFDSRCSISQSVEVYNLVKSLGDKITVIQSNHLWKHLRILNGLSLEMQDCLKKTFSDFENSSIDNLELKQWLESLPFGVTFKDSKQQEYRVCHAFWNDNLYVPTEYDGIFTIDTVSAKSKDLMLYGMKSKPVDGKYQTVRWWERRFNNEFVRVAFHYHTISIDPKGATGNKHIVLDGSCGDEGGVLPVYVVETQYCATF